LADCVDSKLQFGVGGAQRGHENDGVQDWAGEETVAAGGEADFCASALRPWKLGSVGMADLDSRNEAEVADFVDERDVTQTFEQAGEVLDFWGEGFEGFLAFENF
jgi:hypothetical protein